MTTDDDQERSAGVGGPPSPADLPTEFQLVFVEAMRGPLRHLAGGIAPEACHHGPGPSPQAQDLKILLVAVLVAVATFQTPLFAFVCLLMHRLRQSRKPAIWRAFLWGE